MPSCQECPEDALSAPVADSEQHEHDATVQDADAVGSVAEFAHISVMFESLDDELLAGESEIPTAKHEPSDGLLPVQAYPTPELDPAAVV